MNNQNDEQCNKVSKLKNYLRFNLSKEIIESVTYFAKVHQFDDRKDYKEAWELWYKSQDFSDEEKKLRENGWNGNFEDKLFKAGRYYFRRKKVDEKKEKVERRTYISVDEIILIEMDKHIRTNMRLKDYTPKQGYGDFCKAYEDIITQEEGRLLEMKIDKDIISEKFKKTYKNRYFILNNNE